MQAIEFTSEAIFVKLAQEMIVAKLDNTMPAKDQYEKILSPLFAKFNRLAARAQNDADLRENWFFSNLAMLTFDVNALTKKKTKTFHEDVVELVWNGVLATQSKYELRFGEKKK